MGLDITAYRELIVSRPLEDDEEPDYAEGEFRIHISPDFPERADKIVDNCAYIAEEKFRFNAGSYTGYTAWREQLAELAGYPKHPNRKWYPCSCTAWESIGGPFWELINFSDCEGTIGPITSEKLARDFAAFQGLANQHENDWFRARYADFRKAFELASDNGCVRFH